MLSENTLKQTLSYLILGQRGGQNRVQIIEKLRERPYNLNQLSEQLNLNYRTIRHHIESLLKHELVYTSTGGYGEVYFISPDLETNMQIFEDVKKKLTAITTSPRLFQSVMEQTNDAVIVIEPSGEVLFWNHASEKMYGYTSEIVGHPLQIFSDKEDLNKIIAKLRKGKAGVSQEMKATTKSGTIIDVNMSFDRITDDENALMGYSLLSTDITERKRLQEALRLSEERYSLAQRAANIGTWDWDVKSDRLDWSEQMELMFGLEPGKFGQTYDAFLRCVHPEDQPIVKKAVESSLKKKGEYDIEYRIVRKGGGQRWIHSLGTAVFDKKKKPLRMLGTVQDITDRKNAQDAIKRYAAEMDAFVASVAEPILMFDATGVVVVSNRAAADSLGFAPIGITYQALTSRIGLRVESNLPVKHDDSPFAIAQKGKTLIDMPYTIKDVRGDDLSIILSAAPVKSSDKVTGLVVAWHDVTEEKRRIRELRESEEKHRVLVENMDVAYAVHRVVENGSGKPVDYVLLEVNEAFERFTGLQRKNILNKKATEVFPGIQEAKPDLIGIYGKVAQTGKTLKLEMLLGPKKKKFSTTAFSTRRGYFTTTFRETDGGTAVAESTNGA
jgi:PAS domain S-box-containing protein